MRLLWNLRALLFERAFAQTEVLNDLFYSFLSLYALHLRLSRFSSYGNDINDIITRLVQLFLYSIFKRSLLKAHPRI